MVIKAKAGDVRSLMQLYNNKISEGLDVPKGTIPEEISAINDALKKDSFRIVKLSLSEYKRIRDLYVSLDSKLTVFVGDNGYGKSTILDAVFIILSWMRANIQREDKSGFHIKESDINNRDDVAYASLSAQFKLKKMNSNVLITRAKEGAAQKRSNDLLDIKEMASIFRVLNSFYPRSSLPVMAYYSVARSSNGAGIDNKKNYTNSYRGWSKFDAYEDIEFDRRDFGEFLNWFIFVSNKSIQDSLRENESGENTLLAQIKSIENSIVSLKKIEGIDKKTISDLERQLSEKKKNYDIEGLGFEPQGNNNSSAILFNVRQALMRFLPQFTDIELKYTDDDVKILLTKNGVKLDIQQLSQGEKTLFTLVGDLSRRLTLLNPDMNNPLEGHGVILIDEIDLHLHPSWQQEVIGNLRKTFPNIQFIVTTHSPQVVSTVPSKSLRILEVTQPINNDSEEIIVRLPEYQTKGTKNSYALLYGMKTDPIPNVDEVKWLNRYKQLIENRSEESSEGIAIRKKLLVHYGENHPLIMECDGIINLLRLKDKLKKDRK